MKTIFTRLVIGIFFLTANNIFSQSSGLNYIFTQPADTFIYNSPGAGAVTIISGGADDQVVNFVVPSTWSGFFFGGEWYPPGSQLYVSSNGWMSFIDPLGISYPQNSLWSVPFVIAPLWDDLAVHTDGEVSYQITGGMGSHALVVEWKGMLWDNNATDSALSFQALIYDNAQTNVSMRNVIEFRYKRNGTNSSYVVNNSGGASIGISGRCRDLFAFTSSAGAPDHTSPENSAIALKPSDVVSHRFTPQVHPNDECINAEVLVFDPALPLISTNATTLHATQSAGNLPSCGNLTTFNDVWFTFIKPAGITNFEIYNDNLSFCGGPSDEAGIELFSSCGGAPIACNLGSSGPGNTNATSYLNVVNQTCNAQQYWVRAYSTDSSYRGYFRFNIRPPGHICETANDFTGCGLPYISASLSTCGFENNYDSVYSPFHTPYGSGEDYVFSFTPAADVCIDAFLNNTPPNSSPGFFLSKDCPDFTGTAIAYAIGNGGAPIGFQNIGLLAGNTYFFTIDNDSIGGVDCLTNFEFSITQSSAGPPSNDSCTTAVNIPVVTSASCTGAIDFHNNCASPSAASLYPLPGCGYFIDGVTPDVWFTFTSTGTNVHRIIIDQGTAPSAQDLAMAVYSGTCGNFTLVTCDDNSNGLMSAVNLIPPSSGILYYVRVWSNGGTYPGNFRICITDGCTVVNDSCATAILLTPGVIESGDNSCATDFNEPGPPTCWTNNSASLRNTVWYSFVATSDSMRIRVHLLTLFDSQIALYESTGPCMGLNQIFCNDNSYSICGNPTTDRHSEIHATGLVVGSTYYIRLDGTNSNTGTFEIMVQDDSIPFPALYAQDCSQAIPLCDNNTISVSNPGYLGSGNICDIEENSTCLLGGETNSVFYRFNVAGSGAGTPVEFTITPNGFSNCDFMLWCIDTISSGTDSIPAVPNYCDSLSNTSIFPATICNYSFQGITGCSAATGLCNLNCHQNASYTDNGMSPAFVVPDGMTATFLLLVNNSYSQGFSIDWMGTPITTCIPYALWQGNNSDWSDTSNWDGGVIPDCNNGLPAIISTSQFSPVISSNVTVSDLEINPGAMLTISAGVTLEVCGDFTNMGQLVCNPGSTVRFIGNNNSVISGNFNQAINNFYHLEIAKSGNAEVKLMSDIYVKGNDSIYGGTFRTNSNNIEIGGNFYNYNSDSSFKTNIPSTITFTGRTFQHQHFQNDGSPLALLCNVTMNQLTPGSLILDTNSTSDLILMDGTLTLSTGKIVTGTGKVNLAGLFATCTAGNTLSYIEGNLMRIIHGAVNSYDFPVGDSLRGYQRFHIDYTAGPFAMYTLYARFRPWMGLLPTVPVASECGNSGWQLFPVYDNGYWTLDANTTMGIGTYNVIAYPLNVTNAIGLTFSVIKSVSNNGQGPWLLEGIPYCPSTILQVERDSLTSFSDFAIVQSDIGNSINDDERDQQFISVVPNPASRKAIIYFDEALTETLTISLADLTGRIILCSENINPNGKEVVELNLEGITSGIYLLNAKSLNHSKIVKLIISGN